MTTASRSEGRSGIPLSYHLSLRATTRLSTACLVLAGTVLFVLGIYISYSYTMARAGITQVLRTKEPALRLRGRA